MLKRALISLVCLFLIATSLPCQADGEVRIDGDLIINDILAGPGHTIIVNNIDAHREFVFYTDALGHFNHDIGPGMQAGDRLEVTTDCLCLEALQYVFTMRVMTSEIYNRLIPVAIKLSTYLDSDSDDVIKVGSSEHTNFNWIKSPETSGQNHDYHCWDFDVWTHYDGKFEDVRVVGPPGNTYNLVQNTDYVGEEIYRMNVYQVDPSDDSLQLLKTKMWDHSWSGIKWDATVRWDPSTVISVEESDDDFDDTWIWTGHGNRYKFQVDIIWEANLEVDGVPGPVWVHNDDYSFTFYGKNTI